MLRNILHKKHGFVKQMKFIHRFSSNAPVLTNINDSNGIATISLNSPPVNSLDCSFLVACTEAIENASKNKAVKGVILQSNFHGKVFCAGFNILDMFQQSPEHYVQFWTCVQDWYLAWYGFNKPAVAAINGHAPAGGCAMSLMCDYRVMMEGRTIGLNETKLGIAAPFFFVNLMKNAVGHKNAEHGLKTGKLYNSEEAQKIGLVDVVTDLDSVVPTAEKELINLMSVPLPAFAATKHLLRSKYIEQLMVVKSQDSKFFADFIGQDHIQKAMGIYLKNLKAKK